MVMGYGPNEGNGEERERFWNNLDRIVDREGNWYRLCVLGDLNGLTEDRMRADITGPRRERFRFRGERKRMELGDLEGRCWELKME